MGSVRRLVPVAAASGATERREETHPVKSERFIGEERRRHERFTAPALTLAFNGGKHTTESWSLGGFVVDGYQGKLTAGALFVVEGICTADGVLTPVEARARVIRLDREDNRLVVGFLDLDGPTYTMLQDLMAERMRFLEEHRFA
jgi:hypothetical protein